jgi:TfuA protein
MPRTVVFTGPSLHPSEAASLLLNAIILPPVKRGDLASIRDYDPDVIAIIDGEFYQSLSVSPKEILPYLEKGVRVYGASSMGALRAVELERYGMVGIGRVFRLYRMGLLECEDEVALTYCPWTYEAHSEPLVNTRYALRSAIQSSLLSRTEGCNILEMFKNIYFPERTRHMLLRIAENVLGQERAASLADFLVARSINVKKDDAALLAAELSRLAP